MSTSDHRPAPWRTTDLVSGLTAAELARLTGRTVDAARRGAVRYGLTLKPKQRGYPEAVRRRVMRMRAAGETMARISAATGISLRTIEYWCSKAASDG